MGAWLRIARMAGLVAALVAVGCSPDEHRTGGEGGGPVAGVGGTPAEEFAAGSGTGGNAPLGQAGADRGPESDTGCNLGGDWAVVETAKAIYLGYLDILPEPRPFLVWHYVRIRQEGSNVTVTDSLDCGYQSSESERMLDEPHLIVARQNNQQTGRTGTFVPDQVGDCQLTLEPHVTIWGLTEDYRSAELALPQPADPAPAPGAPGWVDSDLDGLPGISLSRMDGRPFPIAEKTRTEYANWAPRARDVFWVALHWERRRVEFATDTLGPWGGAFYPRALFARLSGRPAGETDGERCQAIRGQTGRLLCGNGEVEASEACDDGNTLDGDYCSADCSQVTGRCTDGILQANETCDDGVFYPSACTFSCQQPGCGDGELSPGEACDDGNTLDGDYCSADCLTVSGYCGDGEVQVGEACDDGNLLDGDECSARCQTPNQASPMVAVWGSSCYLRPDGTVHCWPDDEVPSPAGTFRQISCGLQVDCGVRLDGTLSCWGPGFSGSNRTPNGRFRQVSAGTHYACAIGEDDRVSCWGDNEGGKATPRGGRYAQIDTGDDQACGVTLDGWLACWGTPVPGQPELQPGIQQVAVGAFDLCALGLEGELLCWGNRGLDPSLQQDRYSQISGEGACFCALRVDGVPVCWGETPGGGRDLVPVGQFQQLSVGHLHACGLRTDGAVICWGNSPAATVPADL